MEELKKEVFWCIRFSRLLYEQKTMISSHVSTTNACSWTTQIFKLCPFFKTYLIFLFPVNLWDLFSFVFVFICACLEPTDNPIGVRNWSYSQFEPSTGSWKLKYQFLVAEPSFLPLTFSLIFSSHLFLIFETIIGLQYFSFALPYSKATHMTILSLSNP